MRIEVTNHWTDRSQVFEGTHEQVERQLLEKFPWLQVDGATADVMATLDHLDSTSGYQVSVEGYQDHVQLQQPGGAFDGQEASGSQVVQDMLGFQPALTASFQAARFLAGGEEIPFSRMRQALWQHEGDTDAAALSAYGFDVDDSTRAALRAVSSMESIKKSEPITPIAREVHSPVASGEDVATAVARAFADQFVFPVKLGGKHSAGSMLARDEEAHQTWLLKPGSGSQSPAAGAAQDPSTQSAREAAWYQVAKEWDLDRWYPRAELLVINDREYAAMQLLPWSYKALAKLQEKDPNISRRVLQPLLNDGTLHKWAFMDAVLGNPDSHGQNVMVDEDGDVRLIDHGSAFAGPSFDPAYDQDSFVPYYLRAWAPKNFNALSAEQRLNYLPRLSAGAADELGEWIGSLSPETLAQILRQYGINTQACLDRLYKLQVLAGSVPADLAVNRFWVTT